MKGYCVDVRGFSVDKKKLVVDAISQLTGLPFDGLEALPGMNKIGNVFIWGKVADRIVWGKYEMSEGQRAHQISFNDLMLEAGFNYMEDGAEGFKEKSLTEAEKELEKTDQLIESLGVESDIISDLKSDIKFLHQQLRSKSEEIGQINLKLHETEKELSKSRISGAIIFTCLVVVAISNLFFGG